MLQILMDLGECPNGLGLLSTLGDGGRVLFMLRDDLLLPSGPSTQLGHGSLSLGHHVGSIDLAFEVRKPVHPSNVEHERHGHIEVPTFIGAEKVHQFAGRLALGPAKVKAGQELAVIPQHATHIPLEVALVPEDPPERIG
ncbi:hypothetical protein [Streptomyces sp. NRRL S-350]|uniref:hypothetical protein n=1 Tax=Streptomyces sp. NRRL S-350 TaxID=1463902 RepID=UPI00131D80C0|nr:hypothetical protein [Streptomyces sp. NRRL S-350]